MINDQTENSINRQKNKLMNIKQAKIKTNSMQTKDDTKNKMKREEKQISRSTIHAGQCPQ